MRLILAVATVIAATSPLAAQQVPVAPPATAQSTAPAAPLPSVTLPPDLDRVLRDYEKAWLANDPVALAALFTPDGFVLQPRRDAVRGRAGLQATYTGQGGGALKLRALAFSAGTDIAFIIGGYRYGDETRDQGKFTLTLKRVGTGPWLIFSDMDNGNAPPPRPPATPPPS